MTDKFRRSFLPQEMRGKVITISGQYGSGKSILAASFETTSNTIYIDADRRKAQGFAAENPDLRYYPVNSPDRESITRTGELFLDAISGVNVKKTTVVVMDNIYEIEQGINAYVIANPVSTAKMYNLIAGNISGKKYGHDVLAFERIMKGVFDFLIANEITIIVVSHLKDRWMVPGQKEIKARKWIYEAASLMTILIQTDSIPDALIIKHTFNYCLPLDVNSLSDEDFARLQRGEMESLEVLSRLPRKIPQCTAAKIYRYLARSQDEVREIPYRPEETIDDASLAPYRDIITKEQLANLEKIMQSEEDERDRYNQLENSIRESQRAALEEDIINSEETNVPKLIRSLKIKYEALASDITPVYVMRLRGTK